MLCFRRKKEIMEIDISDRGEKAKRNQYMMDQCLLKRRERAGRNPWLLGTVLFFDAIVHHSSHDDNRFLSLIYIYIYCSIFCYINIYIKDLF